jgi:ABC-type antimicrobial peptide transport system permease subunit
MIEFKTFMSLTDLEGVSEISDVLKKFDIPFKIQDTSKDFDVTFSNDTSKNSFLIMLNQNDFDKASSILEDKLKFDINEVNKSHPLLLFNLDELKDVVKNYDEWHPLDVKLAKYLLEEKNITISEKEINQTQLKKEIEAQNPEKSDGLTLAMGYLFCIMGGIAGIGIALFILTGKRTLSNGNKKYIYSKPDRKHAIYMLIAGAISLTIFTLKYS